MINLLLNHGVGHEGVYLRLPATPADIGSAFSMLDRLGTGAVSIFDVECPVPNITNPHGPNHIARFIPQDSTPLP